MAGKWQKTTWRASGKGLKPDGGSKPRRCSQANVGSVRPFQERCGAPSLGSELPFPAEKWRERVPDPLAWKNSLAPLGKAPKSNQNGRFNRNNRRAKRSRRAVPMKSATPANRSRLGRGFPTKLTCTLENPFQSTVSQLRIAANRAFAAYAWFGKRAWTLLVPDRTNQPINSPHLE
jgi:hypothetical protein